MKKDTPIGYSDFRQIIEENRYYVDKTALISAVIKGGLINLLCRPRRFGKSLNLSMLRYFFDNSPSFAGLFEGLMVQQDAEIMQHQGKYPVIMLSFKDVRSLQFTDAFHDLCYALYQEWKRHDCLVGTPEYDKILGNMEASLDTESPRSALFVPSIRQLCDLLSKHFAAPVVVLIDEYDTPLQDAWLHGYYDEMASFLRKLLGASLKDNPNLKRGVLTGILRVSKESMFSDLNNLVASSGVELDEFSDLFGFTAAEVASMLRQNDLHGREMEDILAWYDGYRFGGMAIYNPWSIINYVFSMHQLLPPYWVNTSGNALLKRLFFGKKADIRPYLESLMRGEKITVQLSEHLVFKELEENDMAVLNLLFFSGYLRAENPQAVSDTFQYDLSA